MALDSMDITFDNFNTGISNSEISKLLEVNCYPNPAKNFVFFEFSVLSSEFWVRENNQIRVNNSFGQQVALLPVKSNKTVWDTRNIQPGLYFYSLKSGDSVLAGKLIISK
ncbi:MAG: T9SS type A sorting domain-containing protein [Bacteroidales bacterium]|nr:T9SS type A sorting domain-containing protein [Bacteroidales bacterium]